MPLEYQLIVMGPAINECVDPLNAELLAAISLLGLDESISLRIMRSGGQRDIDWDGIPVALWFGSKQPCKQEDLTLLDVCLRENIAIFPVVHDLREFQEEVPSQLHAINGHELGKLGLIDGILAALRLTRRQRKVFISYKRDDASGVANQLFEELIRRNYWVFLDTVSVEPGVDFQETLWARMADVDLLIFLDTPGALTSQWVHQELARAHDLALGVLQLVWPGQKRTKGTELCDYINLADVDFEIGRHGKDNRLATGIALDIVNKAEHARIASLGKKRIRIVSNIVDQATSAGLTCTVHPVGSIDFYRNGNKVGAAIPVLGTPDAPLIHEKEDEYSQAVLPGYRAIYNGLGVDPEWARHLDWLNDHHLLKTEQVDLIEDWLVTL